MKTLIIEEDNHRLIEKMLAGLKEDEWLITTKKELADFLIVIADELEKRMTKKTTDRFLKF